VRVQGPGLGEEGPDLLVHVTQEVHVGEAGLASRTPVLAQEMLEYDLKLVTLPHDGELHGSGPARGH